MTTQAQNAHAEYGIKFAVDDRSLDLISLVADRWERMLVARPSRDRRKRMHLMMDLMAVQNSKTPLDLERLLAADDFNFCHDVFGIERHLDRDDASPTAGELLDCFLPRFTRKEALA